MNGSFDHTPDSAAAAERVNFQLTYERCPSRRHFSPAHLTGPDIDNAYLNSDVDRTDGDWDNGRDSPNFSPSGEIRDDVSQREWVRHYFAMAMNEGVHEVLEWFQLDGESFIDPHGDDEMHIYNLCAEFVQDLLKMRNFRKET